MKATCDLCTPSSTDCEQSKVLDREIRHLPWALPIQRLESLLRRLGDRETSLVDLPPLRAASRFRQSIRKMMVSGTVTSDILRRAVIECPDTEPPYLEKHFERAFFVFGLRRGGNHAIAEWLKGHFGDGATLHLNSAEIEFFETRGSTLRVDRAGYQDVPLVARRSVCLVGYENLDFMNFPFEHNARVAERSDLIVVLRDYPNMAASIAKSARDRPHFVYANRLRDFPPNWASYARHFRNRTGGFAYLSFNDWFNDLEYRSGFSKQLGLELSDEGLNSVSDYGHGSSFDGTTMNGSAQLMEVLHRWREMMDDDLFCFLLLAEKENLRLNDEIFGNFPHSREDLLALWRRDSSAAIKGSRRTPFRA